MSYALNLGWGGPIGDDIGFWGGPVKGYTVNSVWGSYEFRFQGLGLASKLLVSQGAWNPKKAFCKGLGRTHQS